MMILLSCAKTMSKHSKIQVPASTNPVFQKEASKIILHLSQYSVNELKEILHVPERLAAENSLRFHEFHSNETPSLQALLAYTGIVFKNIAPQNFTPEDFTYAQEHLRITSFCYGLLRPMDTIKPYRLEGNVTIPELGAENMFDFWQKRLTRPFIQEIIKNGGILFNLASHEMKSLFDWKLVENKTRIITPEFKIMKRGKPTTVVIYTKMARGAMTRYIIKNRIENPEEIKSFEWEGFHFHKEDTKSGIYTFIQE